MWKRLLELGNDEAECQTWIFSRGLDGYLVQRAIIPNLPTTQGPLSYHWVAVTSAWHQSKLRIPAKRYATSLILYDIRGRFVVVHYSMSKFNQVLLYNDMKVVKIQWYILPHSNIFYYSIKLNLENEWKKKYLPPRRIELRTFRLLSGCSTTEL